MDAITSLSEPIIYIITFGIVFAETGILAFFFLPGDTLLFTLGLLAYQGTISFTTIVSVIVVAGFLGNLLGYHLGKIVREKHNSIILVKKVPEKYIYKTESFYKKYGSLAVVLSRFVPIVRTISPFLAGVSRMGYRKYLLLSLLGSILWGGLVTTFGYVLAKHFTFVHIEYIGFGLMIAASVLAPLAVYLSRRFFKKG